MKYHWISTDWFTVEVQTRGIEIVRAAPMVQRFLGQPIGNLLNWAKRFGGLRHEVWELGAAAGISGKSDT